MSNETTAVQTTDKESGLAEYVPFGGKDKIKLSISIVQKLVAVKTKSGKTCSDQDALKFIAMCKARHLNPFEGDAYLIGYDGSDGPTFSLITAHQAFLKRAELHPEYDGMKSGVIVQRGSEIKELEGDFFLDGDKLLGGWCVVYFKNRKYPMEKRARLQSFQKSFGVWRDNPATMIVKVVECDGLRSAFPTMLGGLYLKEEIESTERTAKIEVSAPLFKSAAIDIGDDLPKDMPGTNATLKVKCDNAGISEADFLSDLKTAGAVEDNVMTIDQMPVAVAKLALEQFDNIAGRLKK